MLALHVQDVVLDLKRQLVRIVMGAPTSVGQPLNAAFLIAIEDLVARLTGDPNSLHRSAICSPASRRATNCSLSSIGAWVFRGTRMPVATVFENLEAGASSEEITEWFDLTREQITAVLDFAARSLETPAHR